jgi:hypothetical protein
MRVLALLLFCCLALLPVGCGSDSQTESEQEARAARQARITAERQQERP